MERRAQHPEGADVSLLLGNVKWIAARFTKTRRANTVVVEVPPSELSRAVSILTTGRDSVVVSKLDGPKPRYRVTLRGNRAVAWAGLAEPYVNQGDEHG